MTNTTSSNDIVEINRVGMIVIYVAAGFFGLILVSFLVRCWIALKRNVGARDGVEGVFRQLVFLS